MGNSIYTTILARYTSFSEHLLQWYANGRPVRPVNTVLDVKYDGLNTYLRNKHDVAKVVNGHQLSDIKSNPFSKSDTLSNEISSQNNYKTTNRKFIPKTVHLGQDKKPKSMQRGQYVSQDSISSPQQQMESWITDRNNMKSFDQSSPTTPLNLRKLKQYHEQTN